MADRTRKKHYVDHSVQYALAHRVIAHWVIFMTVAAALTVALQFMLENPFESFSRAGSEFVSRYSLVFLVMIALIPVFVFDTIRLSNRFAGPMLRFREALSELADGREIEPIRFRSGDFWPDLAKNFNRVLRRMRPIDEHSPNEQELEAKEPTLAS